MLIRYTIYQNLTWWFFFYRDKDRELLNLSTYLRDIAQYCEDFDTLNHKKWEKYKPDKNRSQQAGSKRKAEDNSPSTTKEWR